MSPEQTLFTLIFLGQILLVSWFLPSRLVARARGVLERYPPERYPRLYVASVGAMERTLGAYRALNGAALLGGLGLLALDFRANGDLLAWNGGSLVVAYMLVQYLPFLACVSRPSFPYFGSERQPDPSSTRSAELRPRRLFDFVSPRLLAVAGGLYVALIALVVVVARYDYPWFGGYPNLIGITALYVIFGATLWMAIRGRRRDPWASDEVRHRSMARAAHMAVLLCIVWASFIGLSILLRVLGVPELVPASLSVVVTLAAFTQFAQLRVEEGGFDVYRAHACRTGSP